MEEEGFLPTREKQASSINGTRSALGLFPDRLRRAATSLEAVATRQSPPVLDRFHMLLRERDEEPRGADGEEPAPLATDDVVRLYEDVLSELTVNSKPVITELTMIAGEQRDHAEGITDAICSRILEVPVEQKLPSLYLLDSIVKNIGGEYVRYFAARLPEVFCEAYCQVPSSLRSAMHHLFRTWSTVFPPYVLGKIETQLQFTSAENKKLSGAGNTRHTESPSRPAHGIHVNPKYLEARRQLEHSDIDAQHPRKRSPSLDAFEQKSLSKYKDSDLGASDVMLSSVSARSSPTVAEHSSFTTENGKAISFERHDLIGSSSPEIGFGRWSHNKLWQENNLHHAVKRQPEIQSIYELPTEFSNNRPRALIEAYGSSKSNSISPEMPSKFRKLGGDGVGSDAAVKKWENSEEEEYLWDDMSPTLADRGKNTSLTKYDTHQGRYGMETRLRTPDASILDSTFKTNGWLASAQPLADERYVVHDEREALIGLGERTKDEEHHVSAEKSESLHRQSVYYGRESWMPDYLQTSNVPVMSSLPAVGRRFQPFPHFSDGDMSMQQLRDIRSDSVNTAIGRSLPAIDKKHLPQQGDFPPSHSMGLFESQHSLQSLCAPRRPFQSADQLNSVGPDKSMQRHGINFSFSSSPFLSDDMDRDPTDSRMPVSASRESSIPYPLTSQSHGSIPRLQFHPREPCGNNLPSAALQVSAHVVQPPNQLAQHVQISSSSSQFLSSVPGSQHPSYQLSGRTSGNPDLAFSRALPPIPPGSHPSQIGSTTHGAVALTSKPAEYGYIGLIGSLMSKGLIALPPVIVAKDFVGLEFNPDLLKVRHESVVENLYANLPRQCTTCGLRFRCQEEHSTHMDWHVTKNRMLRNRKQKPSRKWFVSAKEWLSGAETLGTDAAPGFLPSETVMERKEDRELAVPADINQNLCALCGEPFEEFYSDEADEWMYKGAVYLNAPEGHLEELVRSQLGPIVHAKCQSKSSNN